MRPGDVFLGYDVRKVNTNDYVDELMSRAENIPDVILVRKKYNRGKGKKRIWKLDHMEKDTDMKVKTQNAYDKQYEEFLQDIEEDKDLRTKLNIYKVLLIFTIGC